MIKKEELAHEYALKRRDLKNLGNAETARIENGFKAGYAARDAEIESLQEQVKELKRLTCSLDALRFEKSEQIESLTSQLADANRDTERLNWMIKNEASIEKDDDGGFYLYGAYKNQGPCLTARQAIDVAMKESIK